MSLSPPELLHPPSEDLGWWRCERHDTLCGPDTYCEPCERQAALEDADAIRHRALCSVEAAKDALREAADRLEGYGLRALQEEYRERAKALEAIHEDLTAVPEA